MKPDLDGRTVLGLQPRHKALSETNRGNSSDYDHLGLDHVGTVTSRCHYYSTWRSNWVNRQGL
jgi:hypothetical protein